MKRLALILFLSLVLASSMSAGAQAVGLRYYGIEDNINSDMLVDHTVKLEFDRPISNLEYRIDFNILSLKAENNFGTSICSSKATNVGSIISCSFEGMTEDRSFVTLKFRSRSGITKTDENYTYAARYGISLPVQTLFAIVRLPENGILSQQVANQSYSPADGKTLTDGRIIMVYWERQNVTAEDDLGVSVSFTLPSFTDPFFNFLLGGLVFIVLLSLFAVGVYFRRTQMSDRGREAVKSVLNRNEKVVVDILSRHGGNAVQKVIVRDSDFSKAKVSRLVKSMQERGVVEIEPVSGRENRIILRLDKR
jgi:uncharacterized membrane protein